LGRASFLKNSISSTVGGKPVKSNDKRRNKKFREAEAVKFKFFEANAFEMKKSIGLFT
jgi:hypothetical protein